MSYFFVTQSNFKKIAEGFEDVNEDVEKIFFEIYSEDLSDIFSVKEAKYLYKAVLLMKAASVGFEKLKEKTKDEKMKERRSSSNLFLSTPKYHFNVQCKTLRNDFFNYQIPKFIQDQGADCVDDFRGLQ